MDLELVKFFLDCLLAYYPGSLRSLLVIEKPWFRAGISNLIKYWVPESSQERLHSLAVKDLTQYIARDQLIRRYAKVFDGEPESEPDEIDEAGRPPSPCNSVVSVGSFASSQSAPLRSYARPPGAGRRLPRVPMVAVGARGHGSGGPRRDALHRRSLTRHTQEAANGADSPTMRAEGGELPSPIRRWSRSVDFTQSPEEHMRRDTSWLNSEGESEGEGENRPNGEGGTARAALQQDDEVREITRAIALDYPDLARTTPTSPTVPSKNAMLLESPILFQSSQPRFGSGGRSKAGPGTADNTRKDIPSTVSSPPTDKVWPHACTFTPLYCGHARMCVSRGRGRGLLRMKLAEAALSCRRRLPTSSMLPGPDRRS